MQGGGEQLGALARIAEVWRDTVTARGGGACPAEGESLSLTPARHGTDGFFVAVMQRQTEPDPEPEKPAEAAP